MDDEETTSLVKLEFQKNVIPFPVFLDPKKKALYKGISVGKKCSSYFFEENVYAGSLKRLKCKSVHSFLI